MPYDTFIPTEFEKILIIKLISLLNDLIYLIFIWLSHKDNSFFFHVFFTEFLKGLTVPYLHMKKKIELTRERS